MRIVIAPDSFKGSLTAVQASEVMKQAIKSVDHHVEIVMKPMADGGEGTLEALTASMEGRIVTLLCTGPLGEKISSKYVIVNGDTAIIEIALVAGLVQVPENKRNPDVTTTFGIGEMMSDALDKGCTSFVVGLGGSVTNDGGLGMLLALGMKAYDRFGFEVGPYGQNLHDIHEVDLSSVDHRLKNVTIEVASDVNNPLCGENGASAVYGRQKGATEEQVIKYDQSLKFFSQLIEEKLGESYQHEEGAGAAGGLGFAFLALGGTLVSGAEFVSEAIGLEEQVKRAHLVITGEGKSDMQTLFGKAPGYVGEIGKKYDVPVILLSGAIQERDKLMEVFTGCFSIVNEPLSLKESMERVDELLYEQTKQIFHLAQSMKKHEGNEV